MQHIIPAVLRARNIRTVEDRENRTGIAFKTEKGTKYKNTAWLGDKIQNRIQGAEDWKLVWDEDKIPAIFPPEIVTTSRRPDITLYSPKEKLAVVIELTVPAEENMAQANQRKKCKYEDLVSEGQEAGWEMKYFPVEVGSRGFTNETLRACLKFLGLTNKEVKKALDNISRAALRATYTLWLARNNKKFGSWELVARPYIPPVEEYHMEMPTE